jgi:ABC-type lipoprotein release transport system permease subunit
MIWKTAWKNVWRNRVRSFVVIASVTVGVFAAIFSIAMMNGMIAQRFNAAIDEEISHIQITGKGFRLNNDSEILIPDSEKTLSLVNSEKGISGVVGRKIFSGMAATAVKSSGVQIVGIDPGKEKSVLTLFETVMPGTGDYFKSSSRNDLVLIGQDLAKELNIIRYAVDSAVIEKLREQKVPEITLNKLVSILDERFTNEKKFNKAVNSVLTKKETARYGQILKKEAWSYREGSRLTLTFLDKDNVQVGARFRIAGIYDLKNTMFELSTVFVRNSDLSRLSGLDSTMYHQIVIRISDVEQTDPITAELKGKLPGLDVLSWKEIQPDLAMMTDYTHQIYAIFMLIILAALAFGIVNTMLMVVLERTKELGMLTAIGMNKKKVFSMIMLESVFLSLIGGVAGMFAGWLTVLATAKNGINFLQYAEGMEAYGYSAHVFPEIGIGFLLLGTILIIFTGIMASIYPALKALKLNPVEAIRTE